MTAAGHTDAQMCVCVVGLRVSVKLLMLFFESGSAGYVNTSQ